MEDRYTLLLQKGSGSVVNSYDEWGIVCCSVPFKAGGEVKDFPKRDWPDEDGEDTYFPQESKLKAYDAEFTLAYKGQELASNPFDLGLAFTHIRDFKEWLTGKDSIDGSGTELKIYSPYSSIGRQGCYLSEISSEEPTVQMKQEGGNLYHENVVTFKVKFRVTDPVTDITLTQA